MDKNYLENDIEIMRSVSFADPLAKQANILLKQDKLKKLKGNICPSYLLLDIILT